MNTIIFLDDDLLPQVLGGRLDGDESPVSFVTPKPNLARSLKRRGWNAVSGKLNSARLYNRAGLDESSQIIVDLADRGSITTVIDQVHRRSEDAPIVVVLKEGKILKDKDLQEQYPGVKTVKLRDLLEGELKIELAHAATRRLVRRYQEDFQKAEKVLILLHDDPDPDSLAAALALRAILGRKRQTAVIGSFQPVTRPENLRMVEMLDIQVVTLKEKDVDQFDRIAVLDTQPHFWGDRFPKVDLVIDHHPPQKGYKARFKDLRTRLGATSTILLEHLRAAGVQISERTATGLLYAIKTDTMNLERGTDPADLRSFAYLYVRANLNILRKIEGGGVTMERLAFIDKVRQQHLFEDGFLYAHLGPIPRDDLAPSLADFFLQLDDVKWCAISGEVGGQVTLSLRNLGHQKSAGEVVKAVFGDIGSAGGHRSAAKAVIPLDRFRAAFGQPSRNGRVAAAIYRKLKSACEC
ncbi:MAG: bifunctional oligoribonuclease/PAP phosphatase NrnA [Acidobacteriota bacterium]